MFQVQFSGDVDRQQATPRALRLPSSSLHTKFKVIAGSNHGSKSSASKSSGSVDAAANVPYVPSTYCQEGFLSGAFGRVMKVIGAVVSSNRTGTAGGWKGSRSVLVSAPEGGGKSYFVSEVRRAFRGSVGAGNMQIVQLSGSGSGLRSGMSDASRTRSAPTRSGRGGLEESSFTYQQHNRGGVRKYLRVLIQLLQGQGGAEMIDSLSSTESASSPLRVLVIIDDLDAILAAAASSSSVDEDLTTATVGSGSSTTLEAAYYLGKLLYAIKMTALDTAHSPDHVQDQVVVVGCTRLAVNALPRSHQGAPEFESVVALPRPAKADRQQLLVGMLSALEGRAGLEDIRGVDEEGVAVDVSAGRDGADADDDTAPGAGAGAGVAQEVVGGSGARDVIEVWAERMAGLTAGYLPGDLQQVVRRAVNTHMGRVSMSGGGSGGTGGSSKGSALGGSDAARVAEGGFMWRSMLAVIASQPPRQLQRLSSIVAGVGGGASSTDGLRGRLCWDDFGGYEEVKTVLKRLLKLSRGGPTPAVPTLPPVPLGSTGASTEGAHDDSDACGALRLAQPPTPTLVPASASNLAPTLRGYLKVSSDRVRGVVFHGPPGCGKSFLARIVAAEVSEKHVVDNNKVSIM